MERNIPNKPNVIFFMVDQMGAKWLEAAMNGICDLPNLKRLQSMGVTFTNAFSNDEGNDAPRHAPRIPTTTA